MWFLIMILLNMNGVPGLDKIIVLQTFATSRECQSERDRIDHEMEVAYPDDHDFVLACQVSQKHDS
jgi:hypothetical protein